MTPPKVTVVVPCRNEARWIGECIDAIAGQDYGTADIEVIVAVDPATEDETRDRSAAALLHGSFAGAHVIEGGSSTSSNLNAGLARATGTIVCRVDARSRIPRDYVTACVDILGSRPDVSVTGGAQVARPAEARTVARGIARALNNRWAMGWSRYRRRTGSGVTDTVYLGAFRTEQLRAVGGWDERLATNQDFDLNRRMRRYGDVWFDARLVVGYVPRSDLRRLFGQYHRFGEAKANYWRRATDLPRPRHVALVGGIPALLVLSLLCWLRATPRQRALLAAGALSVAGSVELLGGPEEPSSVADHAAGVLAIATTSTAWLCGVWHGLLRRRPSTSRRGFVG